MKRILLLTVIFLTACDSNIRFDAQGSNNSYLSCSSNNELRYRWRNVILDKTNKSVRSEWYFIVSSDFTVGQHGAIFTLSDNYDKSSYQWGEHTGDMFSDEFYLHKTTLILEVYQKNTYDSLPSSYDITKFRCNVYDDYQAYSEWEHSIVDSLENAAVNEKAKASAAESAKKI